MKGYLDITFGPMFSGKTTELVEKINNYLTYSLINNQNVKGLVINSNLDGINISKIGSLSSHKKLINVKFPDNITFIKVEKLSDIKEELLDEFQYLAIDESQFFKDIEPFVKKELIKGKFIHCVGLISDTNKNKFGNFLDIFPLADNVKQLKAFCPHCKIWDKTACFTKWIGKNDKTGIIEVSASENYLPVCGNHF